MHTKNDSIEALYGLFPEKVISRRGNIEWSSRSPDLNPPECLLWIYLTQADHTI
nr:unnamed protein product [Callosobruchus chinensis]